MANRLLFFMIARFICGAASLFVLLFVHIIAGLVLLGVYSLLTVGYYFYLYRLALAVFLLAQGRHLENQAAAEG